MPAASTVVDGGASTSVDHTVTPGAKPEAAESPEKIESVAQPPVAGDDNVYPRGLAFWAVYSGLLLATFVIGFDSNCVATIIPVITDQFHSPDDVGWYGTA